MKKVVFKSLSIKNFLSVGEDSLVINFKKGINLITGENKDRGGKNGIGKSTILEALYWGLFGITIRDIKKDKIIHNLSKKNCKVEVELSIENDKENKNYKIIRSIEPTKIQIYCDAEDVTHSTMPENDEYIKKIISGSEELFQNAVVMSANNTLPFMAQKKTDKRKFIESILNLNIFSDILLKTRADYNDLKKKNDLLSNSFFEKQKSLEFIEKQKEKSEKEKDEKIKNFILKIEEANKQIELLKKENSENSSTLENNIKENENKIEELEKITLIFNKKLKDLIIENTNLSSDLKHLNKEKQNFIDKGDKCPTCNQNYSDNILIDVKNKISKLDSNINEIKQKINQNNQNKESQEEKIKNIDEGIKKVRDKIKSLNKELSDIKTKEQKICNLENNIKDYNKWIEDYKKHDTSYEDSIKKIKNEIESIEKDLKEIKKSLNVLETVKFVVSEEGVKTFIVKKLLNVLNSRLNYYLQLLDTPCKCEFNELFEETIYNEQGKECSYFNFSGGERKRIDTAILFMFQDLLKLQAKTTYSLNIYDEMIDSALDQKGTEKILEILKDKVSKYEESVYIISHKSSDMANIDNVILLEKENGITKLIN